MGLHAEYTLVCDSCGKSEQVDSPDKVPNSWKTVWLSSQGPEKLIVIRLCAVCHTGSSNFHALDELIYIKVQSETQAAGDFITWLEDSENVFLAVWNDNTEQLVLTHRSLESLLAKWTGIDRDKLEDEKRLILQRLKEQNEKGENDATANS